MCGVAGVLGIPDGSYIKQMRHSLAHRVPDSWTAWEDTHASLVHTRLAINDLADSGAQPFFSRDRRFLTIYNGEIYNHQELRARYRIDAPPCDGAVIPELWSRLGSAAVRELRGMFAICVYDMLEHHVWLAVDPLGMKTIYTRSVPGRLYFSSEAVPLANALGVNEVGSGTAAAFEAWGCLPTNMSGLEGIERMPPGTVSRVTHEGIVVNTESIPMRHWRHETSTWADVVEAFVKSVDLHLNSDAPLGLMLSSGVDSAAIAWAAAAAGRKLQCYTLDVPGGISESDGARSIAHTYGHSHRTVRFHPNLGDAVDDYLSHLDRPTIDGLNVFLTAKVMREEGLKVTLTGTGGDELLAGYRHHAWRSLPSTINSAGMGAAIAVLRWSGKRPDLIQRLERVMGPARWERLVAGLHLVARGALSSDPGARVAAYRIFQPQSPVDEFDFPGPDLEELGELTAASGFTEAEWRYYLAPMLLADSDVFQMAVGIEGRMPFVDVDLLATVMSVPDRRRGKSDFVHATEDRLLVDLLQRPKTGFLVSATALTERVGCQSDDYTLSSSALLQPNNRLELSRWKQTVWSSWRARILPPETPSDSSREH